MRRFDRQARPGPNAGSKAVAGFKHDRLMKETLFAIRRFPGVFPTLAVGLFQSRLTE